MKRIFSAALALLLAACFVAPAFASPLPYINTPFDTPNSAVNAAIQSYNNNATGAAYLVSCTGTLGSGATCSQALRPSISVTGLTTAAGAASAAFTLTDGAVTPTSQVLCNVNGYGGTGIPNIVNIVPAAQSFTFQVQNTAASGALNATVTANCVVFN